MSSIAAQPENSNRTVFLSSSYFLIFLLAGSLSVNLLLAWQIRRLKQNVSGPSRPNAESIVGAAVQSLQATDLEGKPINVALSHVTKPTVLYVLNPRCRWCMRNIDNIKSLAQSAGNRYRFLGLSLDDGGLKEYVHAHDLGFPIYAIPSYNIAPRLSFSGTPEMLVLSDEGKVLNVWLGALTGEDLNNVNKYFGVNLPGVTAGPEQGTQPH